MTKVLSLIGRPNVGKSTLFNLLTRSKDALVADFSGLTRDRQYGIGCLNTNNNNISYIIIDCGGLTNKPQGIEKLIEAQVWQAIEESDAILFLVDGLSGFNAEDQEITKKLRKFDKPLFLVVNKTENLNKDDVKNDFFNLGIGEPYPISSSHNQRVVELIENIFQQLPESDIEDEPENEDKIKIAIIGRPNVGKSTLINRLIGEDRLLAYDLPGTTRDSISVEFSENNQDYLLIDTAGVRRRTKVKDSIEKLSVIKTLKTIEKANVVILLIDGTEGFTDQDSSLLKIALDSGKALVLGVNKWDGLDEYQKSQIKDRLNKSLHFIDFLSIFFVSALHGSNIRDLFSEVKKVYKKSMTKLPTNKLNQSLEKALSQHQPPIVKRHRIKLRYAHQGGQNPPLIIIHGNQTQYITDSYQRYLTNQFRKDFNLQGTPIKLVFKTGDNPYKNKKNTLTQRQINKKIRLKKFTKKS